MLLISLLYQKKKKKNRDEAIWFKVSFSRQGLDRLLDQREEVVVLLLVEFQEFYLILLLEVVHNTNIFQSISQVCHFVINSGSCENIVSAEAVQKLNIPTEKHPKPYKLT